MSMDDAIRQMQESPRQEGARVQAPAPATAGQGTARIGDPQAESRIDPRADAHLMNARGPASTETGNVFNQTPQAEMELVAWMESAIAVSGAGALTLDPNKGNCWRVNLTGDTTITLAAPRALPPGQVQAGRDRDRATGLALLIAKNGHKLGFAANVLFGLGTADLVQPDSNLDAFVFAWWGGPSAAAVWHGKLIDSGLAAWGS